MSSPAYLVPSYALFMPALRDILAKLSLPGFSVKAPNDKNTVFLDGQNNVLMTIKTFRESNALNIQTLLNLKESSFQDIQALKSKFRKHREIREELGAVGIAAWDALEQSLEAASIANSFAITFKQVKNIVARVHMSVLNQVEDILDYEECYLSASRVLYLNALDFFENGTSLNLVYYLDMISSDRGKISCSCTTEDRTTTPSIDLLLAEKNNPEVFARKSLFVNASEMFNELGVNCLIP